MLFYIIFGTNLLTNSPVQIVVFFAYFCVSQKRNIKWNPNGMKPSRGSFLEKNAIQETWSGGQEKARRPRGSGARPPPSWPPLLLLGVGSKSPGSRSVRKSRSRRFHSVWTPFDIIFMRNSKIGKKQQFWAGPPVNRLVPKII